QRLQLGERQLDIALQIVEAYYDAVLGDREAEITAAALEQANVQLEHARRRHEAGQASALDVLNIEVQRDNLEPQRVQPLHGRDQALLTLERLIDLPADSELQLTETLAPEALHPLADAAIETMAAGAVDRRPDVAAAERTIRVRELEENAALGSRMP